MSFQVRILRRAERDLAEIRDYIRRDAPLIAERFLAELLAAIESLENLPERGARPRDPNLRRLGYYFLVVKTYLVFYKIHDEEVWIYRVQRGRRDWEGLLR